MYVVVYKIEDVNVPFGIVKTEHDALTLVHRYGMYTKKYFYYKWPEYNPQNCFNIGKVKWEMFGWNPLTNR